MPRGSKPPVSSTCPRSSQRPLPETAPKTSLSFSALAPLLPEPWQEAGLPGDSPHQCQMLRQSWVDMSVHGYDLLPEPPARPSAPTQASLGFGEIPGFGPARSG